MLKKELEKEVEILKDEIDRLDRLLHWREKEIKIMREYSSGSHVNVMAIALEKITEAMSHTIQSLNSRR